MMKAIWLFTPVTVSRCSHHSSQSMIQYFVSCCVLRGIPFLLASAFLHLSSGLTKREVDGPLEDRVVDRTLFVVKAGTSEWGEIAGDVGEELVPVIEASAPALLAEITAIGFAGTGKGVGAASGLYSGDFIRLKRRLSKVQA